MLILIEKDSATRVPKEVADIDEARAFEQNGFVVHVMGEGGELSPLPAADGAETAAEAEQEPATAPEATAEATAEAPPAE